MVKDIRDIVGKFDFALSAEGKPGDFYVPSRAEPIDPAGVADRNEGAAVRAFGKLATPYKYDPGFTATHYVETGKGGLYLLGKAGPQS